VSESHTPEAYLLLSAAVAKIDPTGAERIVRDGMAKFPAAHGFHLALGELHMMHGEDAEAAYEFQWEMLRAGEARPDGSRAARRFADLLHEWNAPHELESLVRAVAAMQTDARAARDIFEKMLQERGNRFILELYLAEASQRDGDRVEAMRLYRGLIEHDPYFVPAYVQLAELKEQAGAASEANELMQKARFIDPDHWRLKLRSP